MTYPRLLPLLVLLSAWGVATAESERAAPKPDSGPALEMLRTDIRARPSRVLIAVEDALTMNEQAACEIVKEAISLTRADPKLVGEIVFTALKCAPAMTATIVECAVRRSPEAVAEIRAAMKRALGDSAEVAVTEGSGQPPPSEADSSKATTTSGKESGKGGAAVEPRPAEEFTDDFALTWVGVGGIYLLTPSAVSRPFCDPLDPCCSGELTTACLRP